MSKEEAATGGLTFRTQLILFAWLLVALLAIPVILVESYRPWQVLNQLINQAKIVITGVESNFQPQELRQMQNFALMMHSQAEQPQEKYLIWAFNLMIKGNPLPSESTLLVMLTQQKLEMGNGDYQQFLAAWDFWTNQFVNQPELLTLFGKYKQKLVQANQSAIKAGFVYDDVYIMADNRLKLVFVLDGSAWYESTYPGLEYDVVANNCLEFRSYLMSGPGFYTNPLHYYWHIFPKFDSDQWGDWFTVWLAVSQNANYVSFALDLKADQVKSLMWQIGLSIGLSVVLLLLLILFLTAKLSTVISLPIKSLQAGTLAVMNGDYEIRVRPIGSQEFRFFIASFNQLVEGLKERLNMKETLEKILSPELADYVAKHGLVLGGKKVNLSILFTDFAGFTSLTRFMEPADVVQILNDYFSQLIPIIKKWGGLPDKFIGDAIVAIFGAPVDLPNHALNTVCCAIEMQQAMRRINHQRKLEGKLTLEMRIGINSGEVIAGAIGSDMKLEYTSIGEPTNLANRMESKCQIGHILIGESTYLLVKDFFFDGVDFERSPQLFEVDGYIQPVAAYNIYTANLAIKKQPEFAGTNEFYLLEGVDRNLKFIDQLSPEEKVKFKQIIVF